MSLRCNTLYVNGSSLGGNAIVSINSVSGTAVVTTADLHGLAGAEHIDITGTSSGTYDFDDLIVGVVLSTTRFEIDAAYTIDATGGTWTLA